MKDHSECFKNVKVIKVYQKEILNYFTSLRFILNPLVEYLLFKYPLAEYTLVEYLLFKYPLFEYPLFIYLLAEFPLFFD